MQMNNINIGKKHLQKELKNKKNLLKCAKEFGVIGDLTRLKICYLLCRHPEVSVGQIAEVLGLSISAVSHALSKLKEFGVVHGRKDYKQVFYSLKKSKFTNYIKAKLYAS